MNPGPLRSDAPGGAPAVDITALIDAGPLTGFQIRLMMLIGCLVMMDGFDVQAMGFVAPTLVRTWKIDPPALGPIFGAGLLGMLIGSMTLGLVADRVGRRPVLIGSTLAFGLGMAATAAAHSVPQMILLRLLTGIGMGGVMGNAIALASEYSPRRRRASLLMWISCGFTGGAILGGLIAAALIPWGGWQSVFLVGGILPLAAAVFSFWHLPESLQFLLAGRGDASGIGRWSRRIAPDRTFQSKAPFVRPENPGASASVAQLFRDGRGVMSLLLWGVSFANLLDLFFLSNWLPTLFARAGLGGWLPILIGTTLQLGGVIGAIFMGPLIDRIGFYRVLTPAFLIAVLTVGSVGYPGLPLAALFLIVTAAGVCVLGAQPGVNALAASLYPTPLRATGVGWTLGVGRAGSIVGPILASQLIALRWSNEKLFLAAAVPAGLAALMMIGLSHAARRVRGEDASLEIPTPIGSRPA